jgi:hypothetical protein
MEESGAETKAAPQVVFVREEEFPTLYANNLQVEASIWDLKVLFGILDQSVQPNRVVQHTAINLPWTQVKLIGYFLRLAVALHEAENGKIIIPVSVKPPDPAELKALPWADTWAKMSPALKEEISEIYKSFVASL